ncbi:MAG TPA: hypothetical protein VLG37_01085 [Candidatus Saccharimonadales bacterium]|nr:hypothetical protein [Candidatus Saccharimonadales bacterium]
MTQSHEVSPKQFNADWDAAIAEAPYHEIARQAREYGLEEVAANLIEQGKQAAEAKLAEAAADEAQPADETKVESKTLSAEQLRDILTASRFVAVAPFEQLTSTLHSPNKVHATDQGSTLRYVVLGGLKRFAIPELVRNGREFIEGGVSEVLTLAEPEDFFVYEGYNLKETLEGATLNGEKVMLLNYVTMTRSDTPPRQGPSYEKPNQGGDSVRQWGYEYPNEDGRAGNYFGYTILLPESKARKLWGALHADPTLVREMGDVIMSGLEGSTIEGTQYDAERWQQNRPPYGKWRQANGGINRIAFRTASNQTAQESEIVEF